MFFFHNNKQENVASCVCEEILAMDGQCFEMDGWTLLYEGAGRKFYDRELHSPLGATA